MIDNSDPRKQIKSIQDINTEIDNVSEEINIDNEDDMVENTRQKFSTINKTQAGKIHKPHLSVKFDTEENKAKHSPEGEEQKDEIKSTSKMDHRDREPVANIDEVPFDFYKTPSHNMSIIEEEFCVEVARLGLRKTLDKVHLQNQIDKLIQQQKELHPSANVQVELKEIKMIRVEKPSPGEKTDSNQNSITQNLEQGENSGKSGNKNKIDPDDLEEKK